MLPGNPTPPHSTTTLLHCLAARLLYTGHDTLHDTLGMLLEVIFTRTQHHTTTHVYTSPTVPLYHLLFIVIPTLGALLNDFLKLWTNLGFLLITIEWILFYIWTEAMLNSRLPAPCWSLKRQLPAKGIDQSLRMEPFSKIALTLDQLVLFIVSGLIQGALIYFKWNVRSKVLAFYWEYGIKGARACTPGMCTVHHALNSSMPCLTERAGPRHTTRKESHIVST